MTGIAQQGLDFTDSNTQAGMEILVDWEDNTARGDAHGRDLTEIQRSHLTRFFHDESGLGLFYFAYFVCGYDLLVFHLHYPISRFISQWGKTYLKDGSVTSEFVYPHDSNVKQSFRRLMLCIPRDCFKTTIATKANSLWIMTKNSNNTVGIFNENANNAESWVSSMCEIVEASSLFQFLWKDILPKGITQDDKSKGITRPRSWKWGPSGMRFVRDKLGISELSIEPHGIGGTAVGKHFTHKILDDIIGEKSVKSSDSQAVMDAAKHWVDNSRPLERPAERGLEMVAHTPWAFADVYTHMQKRWPGEFRVYKRALLETEGKPDALFGQSIFPEKISTREARDLLKRDPFVNSAQYQCLPRPGRETSFESDWIRYGQIVWSGSEPIFKIHDQSFDPDIFDVEVDTNEEPPQWIPLSWMEKSIVWDPIPGDPRQLKDSPNCYHGINVIGKDPWGRRFCFESVRVRETPKEVFETVMKLCEKWSIRRIGIEMVNFAYVYEPLFNQMAEKAYDWSPDFTSCETKGRHKNDRILGNLQHPMETGFWYFNERGTMEIIQEITEFPHCEFKDCIDSLAYTDEVVFRPETPRQHIKSYYRNSGEDRGVTGYGW